MPHESSNTPSTVLSAVQNHQKNVIQLARQTLTDEWPHLASIVAADERPISRNLNLVYLANDRWGH